MKTCFIDTNLFIRYLTNDDQEKADRVEKLLDAAAITELNLVTTEMVMAEIVWVLESAYGLKAAEISQLLRAILAPPAPPKGRSARSTKGSMATPPFTQARKPGKASTHEQHRWRYRRGRGQNLSGKNGSLLKDVVILVGRFLETLIREEVPGVVRIAS